MTPRQPTRILLLQLEFPTWKQARAWTYPACFGVAEGLRASGVECVTLPLIADAPYSSKSWLEHMKRMVAGQRFDQVWVWLVHAPLDDAILQWLSEVAPIRVGIIMESLQYSEEDYAWAPHLRARQGLVEQQVRALTHVRVPDECDVEPTTCVTGVSGSGKSSLINETLYPILRHTSTTVSRSLCLTKVLPGSNTWIKSSK